MDKQKFIENFNKASSALDMTYINTVISGCLDRCHALYPQYERGHMNLLSTTEECGEFITAISKRKRGREEDNYELMEEMADVILSILCIAEYFGISYGDIRKAINVKADREFERIREQLKKDNKPAINIEVKEGPNPLKLSDVQTARINDLYNAAYEYLKILTAMPFTKEPMQWDQDAIDELNGMAADMMYHKGHKIHFPSIVAESDGYMRKTDFYEPDKTFDVQRMVTLTLKDDDQGVPLNELTTIGIRTPLSDEELMAEIMGACDDFLKTPEGRKVWEENGGKFDYGDFETYVTNEFCIPHKFRRLNSVPDIIEDSYSKQVGHMEKSVPEKRVDRFVALTLRDQDGPNTKTHVITIRTPLFKEEIIPAIKAACQDYVNTPEGKEVYNQNGETFNYGDFDKYVTNTFCTPHGFYRVDGGTSEVVDDNFNVQLAFLF